jgi:hypothetical protein
MAYLRSTGFPTSVRQWGVNEVIRKGPREVKGMRRFFPDREGGFLLPLQASSRAAPAHESAWCWGCSHGRFTGDLIICAVGELYARALDLWRHEARKLSISSLGMT